MKSETIKVVAGGGKTTKSASILKTSPNGLYLAFTNSVINEMAERGFLARTIDGLFQSFIFPKFMGAFSLACSHSTIESPSDADNHPVRKSAGCIRIKRDGKIVYKSSASETNIGLNITDNRSKISSLKKYRVALETVFGKEKLLINDQQRADLAAFLLANYGEEIAQCMASRFDYIVIDEAQDLSGYREEFAALLYKHRDECPLILLGDDMQNVCNGGCWFENLPPDEVLAQSHRCPEAICEWIRKNLGIEIYGDAKKIGKVIPITNEAVLNYNDGCKTLLYVSNSGPAVSKAIKLWEGPKRTIRSAKGSTIYEDIVIVGGRLNVKNIYTALTRTTKNAYLAASVRKDCAAFGKSSSSRLPNYMASN